MRSTRAKIEPGTTTGTGLRRVDWVRIVVDDDNLRAEAVGMGFRLPATCQIPLAMAAELVAAGTPHVTHFRSGSGEGQADGEGHVRLSL